MGLSISHIIIIILWGTLSIIATMEYIHYAKELSGIDKVVFFFIFLIGGPLFGINEILVAILNCILPEGWDDEDDSNKKY